MNNFSSYFVVVVGLLLEDPICTQNGYVVLLTVKYTHTHTQAVSMAKANKT